MSETLEIENNSEIAVGLSKLSDEIDKRLVESGEITAISIQGPNGLLQGVKYSALVGLPNNVGEHSWHTVEVRVPEESGALRRYSMSTVMPLDGPLEWADGDKTARYDEYPPLSKARTKEVEADELKEMIEAVQSGRLLDPTKEKVVTESVDRGGMVVMEQKVISLETPPPKGLARIRRALSRKAIDDQPKAIR